MRDVLRACVYIVCVALVPRDVVFLVPLYTSLPSTLHVLFYIETIDPLDIYPDPAPTLIIFLLLRMKLSDFSSFRFN